MKTTKNTTIKIIIATITITGMVLGLASCANSCNNPEIVEALDAAESEFSSISDLAESAKASLTPTPTATPGKATPTPAGTTGTTVADTTEIDSNGTDVTTTAEAPVTSGDSGSGSDNGTTPTTTTKAPEPETPAETEAKPEPTEAPAPEPTEAPVPETTPEETQPEPTEPQIEYGTCYVNANYGANGTRIFVTLYGYECSNELGYWDLTDAGYAAAEADLLALPDFFGTYSIEYGGLM